MRDNGGGSPATVALLVSYLFDQPGLPLFDVISRSGAVETYATEPQSAALQRNGRRPVWVLTSRRTFSGERAWRSSSRSAGVPKSSGKGPPVPQIRADRIRSTMSSR